MSLIEVSPEDAGSLEKVAPSYLKGTKATTRRVSWAICELVRLLGADTTNADSPEDIPAPQN